jgi:hypothetical protein
LAFSVRGWFLSSLHAGKGKKGWVIFKESQALSLRERVG